MTTQQDAPPLGATVRDGGIDFCVWAPDAGYIEIEHGDGRRASMQRAADGVWTASVDGAAPGTRYRFRLDEKWGYPDPYSRFQPEGPHGHSQVVDPSTFRWTDAAWRGPDLAGLVLYELHIGTYTPEGTFDALIPQLDALASLGVNAIELMPVAEFPGSRNWGYDGVDLFAPAHVYGDPDALRRLVDAAHTRGIAVILDVVYNHLGPDGNFLHAFAHDYFTERHSTPWGDSFNFDGERSSMVRRYILDNVRYWLREYRIDGLRVDAAFTFKDDSPNHILQDLTETARSAAPDRRVLLFAETYENDARYVRPLAEGGFGFDGVWADDFHHVVQTFVTKDRGGYYSDYEGTLTELAQTINRGWLYEGQQSEHFHAARGTSAADIPAPALVYHLQNHDQVANRLFGRRLAADTPPDAYRMWSMLLLLLPYTPLLFQGQEFGATTPFFYFTDHSGELGRKVTEGRFEQFALYESEDERRRRFPDPQAHETFLASRLNIEEREDPPGSRILALYRALITLRRHDPVLSRQSRAGLKADASGDDILTVRMNDGARTLVLNAGDTPRAVDAPTASRVLLTSDEARFGGEDREMLVSNGRVTLPPRTAAWLAG